MEMLLDLLAHLDWFERVGEIARWLGGVKSWRFYVPRNCGWSGQQIEQLLRRHGVKVWGRGFTHDNLFFRVKLQQANWAEYLLWRGGISVSGRPFNVRNRLYGRRYAPGSEPPVSNHGTNRSSWLEEILSLFF